MQPAQDVQSDQQSKKELRAEEERRAAFLEEARTIMPYVSVAAGREIFFVPTSDDRIGARLFARARSKDMLVLGRALEVLDELEVALPDDALFVDVGANLGTATTTALRRHGFARAVALEPSPGNFKALRLGLVANDLESRVRALQVAASDTEGERAFDVSQASTGAHRLAAAGDATDTHVAVRCVTLDGLVSDDVIDVDHVGLVWVDTAGHEAHALRGGRRLLEAGVPLVTAIKHGWPETEDALAELLPSYYTHVVQVRGTHPVRPIAELRPLIDALQESTDVLVVRR